MGSRLWTRRSATVVALALGVGLLAGCGPGDPEPTGSGSLTAGSPTPTAVETNPTELVTAVPLPVMPPEMANNDAAGAEAAARFFVSLIEYTYANRDVAQFAALTDDDCVFCQGVISEVDRMLAEGVTREGGSLRVVAAVSNEYSESTGVHLVRLQLAEGSSLFFGPGGEKLSQTNMREYEVEFALSQLEIGWMLLASGTVQ